MKSFLNYIREFTGDGEEVPPAGPQWKTFKHRVYQLSENGEDRNPHYHVSSQDEAEYEHFPGNITLPLNDKEEANNILRRQFDKFHLATSMSHDHNYPDETWFTGINDNTITGAEPFGGHHHGDGDEITHPACSHGYHHYLESMES